MVDVGTVVVNPDLLRPGIGGGFPIFEEEDVRLDAVGVEDAGGQAQDGVQLGRDACNAPLLIGLYFFPSFWGCR